MNKLKKVFNWRIYLARLCDLFHLRLSVRAHTFWGEDMRVVLPDGVSAAIFCYHRYENDLTDFLVRLIKQGDIAIDVGAHYGYFTLLMAHLVGAKGAVHAFEATPRTYGILVENTRTKSNVVANQKAAWREVGMIDFFDFGVKYPAGNTYKLRNLSVEERKKFIVTKLTVPTITLDSYCQQKDIRPTFIKLDAEQSEFQILKGMDWLLREVRPVISLETWEWADAVLNYREAIALMCRHNYQPYLIERGKLTTYKPKEPYPTTNLIFISRS